MIDFDRLNKAYEEDRLYALQLEVGDICRQGCIYCYMNALPREKNRLSDDKIIEILDDCEKLNISAIEWLGGEPLLRESVFDLMAHARGLGLKNNMWTGGLPMADEAVMKMIAELCDNGLVSFHLSTVNPDIYRITHPERTADDIDTVIGAVEKLIAYGYPPERILNSVTFTGLQPADDMIATIDYFEKRFGIKASLNIYHTYLRPGLDPGELARFIPSRPAVSRVYRRWAAQYEVKRLPMNCVNKQYCSATAAVLCDGSVTPCATIRPETAPNVNRDGRLLDIVAANRDDLIFKVMKSPEGLPEECRSCKMADSCWGCRSRAYADSRGIYGSDPRCFRKKPSQNR